MPARPSSMLQSSALAEVQAAEPSEVRPRVDACPVRLEQALIQSLQQRIGPARYGLWFRGQTRFCSDGEAIVAVARNHQVRDWLEQTFGLAVREAAKEVCGMAVPVRWSVDAAAIHEEEAATPSPAVARNGYSDLDGSLPASRNGSSRNGTFSPSEAIPPRQPGDGEARRARGMAMVEPSPDHRVSEGPNGVAAGSIAGPSLVGREHVSGRGRRSHKQAGVQQIATIDAAGAPMVEQRSGGTDLFGEPLPPARSRKRANGVAEDKLENAPRGPRRWKRLEDFVVGACNRVAHAAAVSVVEEPEEAVTPLVFHGPVGVGKTHLLEGIYIGLKCRPQQHPCYVTAEDFTSRFVQAAHQGRLAAFRRQFRDATALLFDDLHFLATRKATQIEFLHTLDALVSEGRPVVVSLDCHPRLADELMPELVDRLLGGAVWGLLPPDATTRLAILRHKAASAQPPIPDLVLRTLANCLRGNVRELEGAIHSLRHYARVAGRPIDLALAREALGELIRHAVRVVTVPEVDAAVCTVLRLTPGTLQSKSRSWAVTHPRMLAVYLCRKHTAATYGEIARHFGAKTHSTAVAAEKKVRQWLDSDAALSVGSQTWNVRDLLERIERQLQR